MVAVNSDNRYTKNIYGKGYNATSHPSSKERQNMKKQKFTALFALILMLTLTLTGCFEEESEDSPISVKLWGGQGSSAAKIYAGDNTTFVVIVENNREKNYTVTLSVTKNPTGWVTTLSQSTFNLTKKASYGSFLVVNSSQDAKANKYKITIKVTLDSSDWKRSFGLSVSVIEEKGVRVREGDKVAVDYLGYLGDFRVFDTSNEDIATENAIMKATSFSQRPSYEPLKVYVGPEDPDTSDDYISTVVGFWEAIKGMRVGQSRTVVLQPSKAYGLYENTTINLTEELTMFENMTLGEFNQNYGVTPMEGMLLKHHMWEWNITVDYVNQDENLVRILNQPRVNQITTPYGWDTEVTYKNQSDNGGEGRIIVEHDVEVGMQGVYRNHSAMVNGVEDGQITIEYNSSSHELAEEILIFDITLVDILD